MLPNPVLPGPSDDGIWQHWVTDVAIAGINFPPSCHLPTAAVSPKEWGLVPLVQNLLDFALCSQPSFQMKSKDITLSQQMSTIVPVN